VGVEVESCSFLTSELDGGDWSTSWPGRFIPENYPRQPLTWKLGDNNSQSGRFGIEKNLFEDGDSAGGSVTKSWVTQAGHASAEEPDEAYS
jgi:hypothetical protein